MTKRIYRFGAEGADGGADDVERLGGKGAHLAEMTNLGLPVPPGMTISTEACAEFHAGGGTMAGDLERQLLEALDDLESETARRFGDEERPLILSVRSGARVSMPGMMDTVLNIGLNDRIVERLSRDTGDRRFAWDSYRRLIQMYGEVVMGVDQDVFEDALEAEKEARGVDQDSEMSGEAWQAVATAYKGLIEAETGKQFPQDPRVQLSSSIAAVFTSWSNRRAVAYRRLHDIPEDWGTAVNVQTMVFGNRDDRSATGVVFTRNPSNGERSLFGEFLINAQGEDVVAGLRTPQPLTERGRTESKAGLPSMEKTMPDAFDELRAVCSRLESHYRDVQDVEFTVENGKLWILQTRRAKRTSKAAVKIAVDMVDEGLIDPSEAVSRIDPEVLDQVPPAVVDPSVSASAIGSGLPASPGAATGEIVFTSDDAVAAARDGRPAILIRIETSPEDIEGMHAAAGILTTRGGMTSHAAVVARGIGKPCVAGAGDLQIDLRNELLVGRGVMLRAGDIVTIDGASGRVFEGTVRTVQPPIADDLAKLRSWADELRFQQLETDVSEQEDEMRYDESRRDTAEEIYTNYDFGYQVEDAGGWTSEFDGHVMKKVVYLAPDDPETQTNLKAEFAVRFEDGTNIPYDAVCVLDGERIGNITGGELADYVVEGTKAHAP